MKEPIRLVFFLAGLTISSYAFSLPEFRDEWITRYGENSPIDDNINTQCQICHVSPLGGSADGWNAYGWRVLELLQTNSISNALINAGATSDSDFDPNRTTNIVEIESGFHPGWTEGNNNEHFFRGGGRTQNHAPPSLGVRLDPPSPLADPIAQVITRGSQTVSLQTIADGFSSPLLAITAPGILGSLFVVDQIGIIWKVSLSDGSKTEFLNITSSNLRNGLFDERGLLGLAFHPNYASNGIFYTYQSQVANGDADFTAISPRDHQSVIVEWSVSDPAADTSVAIPRELMRIDQPQSNHNGGMLAIDGNGLLYISLGDGGSRDDEDVTIEQPNNQFEFRVTGHGSGNSRNPRNPLGSILRIDPNSRSGRNGAYGIPSSNPFDGSGVELAEIYAYGLRNVYRFSFDSLTGELFAADVGQGDIEEVNIIEAGGNYGWNYKEGSFWFYPNSRLSGYVSLEPRTGAPNNLIDPILEYDHDEGSSITGGYVYRGSDIPSLNGAYIFGDLTGRLFYSQDRSTINEFRLAGQPATNLVITGFGQDQQGEVYVLGRPSGDLTTGMLQKIVPAEESTEDEQLCFPVVANNGSAAIICL